MNIVTVKCAKQEIGGGNGALYAHKSCKGLFCKDTYKNSHLEKSEESKVQDSA